MGYYNRMFFPIVRHKHTAHKYSRVLLNNSVGTLIDFLGRLERFGTVSRMYIERFSGTNIGFLGRFCTRKGTNQTVRLFDFNTKITVFTMKYDQDSFDWRQSYDFFLTFSIIIK